jgi:hypothetical protein
LRNEFGDKIEEFPRQLSNVKEELWYEINKPKPMASEAVQTTDTGPIKRDKTI